jgi:hypothetical protein
LARLRSDAHSRANLTLTHQTDREKCAVRQNITFLSVEQEYDVIHRDRVPSGHFDCDRSPKEIEEKSVD